MISFFFFSSAHHLLQKQLRTYGIAHFLVKHDIWAASLNIASCLFVLMAQLYLFCLINVVKVGNTGIPQGIIRNKSLFIQGKFSSRMCSCLSYKEVMLISVLILKH